MLNQCSELVWLGSYAKILLDCSEPFLGGFKADHRHPTWGRQTRETSITTQHEIGTSGDDDLLFQQHTTMHGSFRSEVQVSAKTITELGP